MGGVLAAGMKWKVVGCFCFKEKSRAVGRSEDGIGVVADKSCPQFVLKLMEEKGERR